MWRPKPNWPASSRDMLNWPDSVSHAEPGGGQAEPIASRSWPGQQHNLAAEAAGIDAGMDLGRGRERQTVDDDGMDGAIAQQAEQRGHVGLELFRVGLKTIGD